MKIKSIEINNIRNIGRMLLNLNNKNIVIFGRNAQGKTTILESIYYLSIGKTMRRGLEKNIIKRDKSQGKIKGIFEDSKKEKIEIEFLLGSKKISKQNNSVSKLSDVVGQIKAVLFTAEDLSIIESPQKRRRFLDILLSLLDKKYLRNLLEYRHVLKQRNKLLFHIKQEKAEKKDLYFWDEKISTLGEKIVKRRIDIVKEINKILEESIFFKNKKFNIKYIPVATEKEEILKRLVTNFDKEVNLYRTTVGPHRDSIIFYVDNLNLDYYGSRGEKRGAIIELKKAEIEIIKKDTNENPILLLDDVLSELDKENQEIILNLAKDEQTIITTATINDFKTYPEETVFYEIKNGEIV